MVINLSLDCIRLDSCMANLLQEFAHSIKECFVLDDSVTRFWGKYIVITITYDVPEPALHWCIRHVEVFVKRFTVR